MSEKSMLSIRKASLWIAACLLGTISAAQTLSQPASDALAQARALADEGKIAESEAALRSYLSGHADSADAHFLLGYVLFPGQKARE